MFSAETLLSVLAALAVVRTLISIAHMFKLDGLLSAKLDAIADKLVEAARKTPDPSDDRMAEAEAAIIRSAAEMIKSGKIDAGIGLLENLLRGKLK